jgi:hypothetical protein
MTQEPGMHGLLGLLYEAYEAYEDQCRPRRKREKIRAFSCYPILYRSFLRFCTPDLLNNIKMYAVLQIILIFQLRK